ncbi:MAG: alpha/beta hydrolase [Gaiellaceae bacterium]
MGRSRAVLAVVVAALVCAGGSAAARASAPTTQEVTIAGAGGVQLACELVLPAGTAPNGDWPGLVLFPGLGDTPTDGTTFAAAGFASISCDERGTGSSGGSFDLAGPTDAQDAQAIFDWLAARPEVSDTQIGAYGEDLGGAEVWNAAVAGVPFKAIIPADTWSSLGSALRPTGAINAGALFLLSAEGPPTWNTPAGIAARSYRPHLHSLTVPTLIVHDRADFLWDLSQATAAYRLLAGPKRVFITWSGAPPPEPEVVAWFRHYLAGGPTVGSGVEIQHEDPDKTTTVFRKLPPTRFVSVNLPGRARSRSVRLPGGPFETFGAGSVTVRYAGASWKQVVAQVSTPNGTLVTEGAAPVRKRAGVLTIPLLDEAVLLRRGRKLVVSLSNHDAEFGGSAGGRMSIARVTLNLSVLRRAVSR